MDERVAEVGVPRAADLPRKVGGRFALDPGDGQLLWIEVFLAETSATCGGLDSLLEPTGPLREAQRLAAETFGSRETFWVTNGTSTANKIVVQALVRPDDIVLVDRNCHQLADQGPRERAAQEATVRRLTLPKAPLPNFSVFHATFRPGDAPSTPEGDMRRAFFTAYDENLCEYLTPAQVSQRLADGARVVSATFGTPYPPGFPVLVPGQCFSSEILEFMSSLDTPEVHGYRSELGYRVFTDQALHPDPAPADPTGQEHNGDGDDA